MDLRYQLRFGTMALIAMSALPFTTSAQEVIETEPIIQNNPQVNDAYELFASGEADAALEQFQAALEENSSDLSAQLGQAMVFADLQRHQDAFSSYDNIVQQHPKHAFAWNGRGLAAFNMEDFDEALSSFEQATAERPINGFFYETLAWTHMCRGEYSDAVASAKTATLMYSREREDSAYPLLITYFAYAETGDFDNANKALRYAYQNKPLNRWPAPIIDFLSGGINEAELIGSVTSISEETEAHTYIGLRHRINEAPEEAKKHLEWVARNGDPRVFEYTLSRALNLQDSVALLVPQM